MTQQDVAAAVADLEAYAFRLGPNSGFSRSIRTVLSALQQRSGDERERVAHPVRYAVAQGATRREMQAAARQHPIYQLGDAKLVWVNEGDLYMGSAREIKADAILGGQPCP